MARKFASATALLNDLLDRREAGEAQAPRAYPDEPAGFSDINAYDAFLREIEAAERAGAVAIGRGTGRRRDELKFVRLVDPLALSTHLGREPAERQAAAAHARAVAGLTLAPALAAAAQEIAADWALRRRWCHLGPHEAGALRTALLLAQAIVERRHAEQDYRTFSRRIAGDSKALERLEAAVVTLVRAAVELPPEADPRAALAVLGLERFGAPLLLSGPLRVDGVGPVASLPYLGLPPTEIGRIAFTTLPAYLLTIENLASFHRHVLEADPDRTGLVLYVGGYPSLAIQRALTVLSARLPLSAPFYHWSDIDPDGIWIFRTVERVLGRPLSPHLMSVDLAEQYGERPNKRRRAGRGRITGSLISELSAYLEMDDAKYLEQEEIDPVLPVGLEKNLMICSPSA